MTAGIFILETIRHPGVTILGGGAGANADGQQYTVDQVKRAFSQERQLALKMRMDRLANMVGGLYTCCESR